MGVVDVDNETAECFVCYCVCVCVCARAPAGTSTDVSRYAGQYEHVFESTTAGVTLQAPQLDINTVAAGGGSRLFFRHFTHTHSQIRADFFHPRVSVRT